MQYIDTGTRVPEQALGSWLQQELQDPASIAQIRWQSGFFGAGILGYFSAAFEALRKSNSEVHLLIGSNDGTTRRGDVASLLQVAGPSRSSQKIAVVSFESGYFHAKVVHLTRSDGTSTAYVGSGNLTESGVSGLHVEAGLLLDAREGDEAVVLGAIADSVDAWFTSKRPGMYPVATEEDLDQLVIDGILGVARPQPVKRPGGSPGTPRRLGPRLKSLLVLPSTIKSVPSGVPAAPDGEGGLGADSFGIVVPADASASTVTGSTSWQKRLSISDAQRKPTGNQRGSITLVGGQSGVDTQRFFRFDFFESLDWASEQTRTGRLRETAVVPFSVRLNGVDIGQHNLLVTYAPNRESKQRNYTSLLHLGSLAPFFVTTEMQGEWLSLVRTPAGTFELSIG